MRVVVVPAKSQVEESARSPDRWWLSLRAPGTSLEALPRCTLVALGRPAEAIPHLRAALDRNPDSEVAHYLMAQACQALGDTVGQEKALAAFAQARARTAQRTALAPQTPRDVTPQQLEGGGPR